MLLGLKIAIRKNKKRMKPEVVNGGIEVTAVRRKGAHMQIQKKTVRTT